jgi:hypothetical protein
MFEELNPGLDSKRLENLEDTWSWLGSWKKWISNPTPISKQSISPLLGAIMQVDRGAYPEVAIKLNILDILDKLTVGSIDTTTKDKLLNELGQLELQEQHLEQAKLPESELPELEVQEIEQGEGESNEDFKIRKAGKRLEAIRKQAKRLNDEELIKDLKMNARIRNNLKLYSKKPETLHDKKDKKKQEIYQILSGLETMNRLEILKQKLLSFSIQNMRSERFPFHIENEYLKSLEFQPNFEKNNPPPGTRLPYIFNIEFNLKGAHYNVNLEVYVREEDVIYINNVLPMIKDKSTRRSKLRNLKRR